MTDIYMVAGEPSGDRLGGSLIAALTAKRGGLAFHGVGGLDMEAAGLRSIFPMSDLTVMGLSEVVPRLPLILQRIRETAADIVDRRPDALVTIDAPDFCMRVAAKVRREIPDLPIIHYVAPSVWAWRSGRAKRMARHVDHVLALLPFEPPYMHAAGMSCDFVGHPVAARSRPDRNAVTEFRLARGIDSMTPLLLIAPGSRRAEVRRLTGDFAAAIDLLKSHETGLEVVCPVAETVEEGVIDWLSSLPVPVHAIRASDGAVMKTVAFAAADVALCASGTVTLELAAVGTPMVAAYRTTWMTAQIVRRVVKVNSANLINLISGSDAVPELLQEFCTPETLCDAVLHLLEPSAAQAQREVLDSVLVAMGRGGAPPEDRAAESVLAFLDGHRARPLLPIRSSDTDVPGPTGRHLGKRGGR
ncbi:MAG: lipid-A-disaccharide synthase [Pseudomonadota bacterium]